MRRVTEELQPTLLDNVGLFTAALRWQIKHMCHRSSICCAEHLPDVEPSLGGTPRPLRIIVVESLTVRV